MDGVNIYFWAAVVYGAVAFGAVFRAGYFQWFWSGVFLWAAVSLLGAKLVPGMWGITHAGPLFLPHFYLTVASVFFFLDHWRKEDNMWVSDGRHPFLALFAVSNALMTLLFVGFAAVLFYQFPSRSSVFGLPVLLEMYALAPLYWFAMQGVLMAVWYLHRVSIAGGQAHRFSGSQINGGIALAWLMMVAVGLWLVISVRL